MKILLIVVLVLTSYAHCEEAEEWPEKYLFEKDNEISRMGTNQNIPNGQFLAIPKAQSFQYIKNSRPRYQLQQNPSYGYNNPASVPYQVTYKLYPQTAKTYDYVPVKQNVATQFTDFANLPQTNHLASYQMVAPKESKFFVDSPKIYEKNNAGFGSNSYGSNQYKFAEQYSDKPTIWTGVGNGVTNGFVASGNRLASTKEYLPGIAGYGAVSTNSNGFKTVKAYSSVYSGHGIPSSNGYPVNNNDVATFVSNGYRNPKEYASIPSGSHEYNRKNFGNSFMYVPKSTNVYSAEYSSVPSFESSLRDIVKMVKEEQRKSNGKAIFLIGKPQFPPHMLKNPVGYSAPSIQYGSNIGAFSGYKY